ncbi:hypothetical protein IGI04_042166 [Brassica rapa subsp. trilocularis]|uniref:Uncharacterized protein n=1 Tax=Brassica rapa subsp. trilocularis TaxID=1813537 RepID=A0ABQ7KIZ8_BRACM|nr:hypothetical protein IGI04_042166 [Brassica rapa subsp. trilocularis]
MKRNRNKEFQSQVIFSTNETCNKTRSRKKSSPLPSKHLHLLNPKCRVWCLDIDRWYLCTSIDINLHLSRHFLISIVSTDAHRSIILPLVDLLVHKYKVNALPWEYRSQDSRISDRYLELQTGFHESKLNGGCHQVLFTSFRPISKSSLRKQALKIAASKSRFELFYLSLYESSLNGVTFQTCLKNPIPCIPSPKTSGYVWFSVGNQLWLLHTVQGKSTKVKDSIEVSMVKPSCSAMILGRILTDSPVSHMEWGNSTPLTTHGIANFPGSLFFVNVILCFIFSLT